MKLVDKEVGETWEKPGDGKEYKQNLLYEKKIKVNKYQIKNLKGLTT